MSSKILLKKSTTASAVPTTNDLDTGEVAINTEDKRLFTKDSGGSIVEVSTTPSTMDVDGATTVGGTLGVTGNTTLSGTLGVTGATTLGTATVSTKLTVPAPVDNTDAASKGYVDTEVSSAVATVIDSSPAALDTLNELAAALGDDPNFSTTITTTIGTKLPKDGSEAMSGNLDLGTNKVVNVVDPTSAQDAATKSYVDTADALKLNLSGGTMSGDIAMGTNSITGLADPTSAQDAATKAYIDSVTGSLTDAADSAADAEKLAINPEDSQYTLSDGTTTGFSALHYAAKADDSATAAGNAQTAAEAAQTAAETAYDNFDDRYLGAKATAPALDNDGDALVAGALYFDTTAGAMYVYDGSAWDQVALTPGDFLTVNNNLSDLSNTATAISNLGITATAAELNFVDGVTSNIQTQIDNIDVDPTKGSLTKSFANGETASITLSGAISPAPVVSVTKEVAQVGITSKGGWDVATDGSNYELHDTAYDTTLTPGQIGFLLSEASYDSVSFSVASETSGVQGFRFGDSGLKVYVTSPGDATIYQYNLSTAYDITTATYASKSFSASSQSANSYAVDFKSDGTKMYVLGLTNDTVYQYSLSTAWDVSTASYDSVSFSVNSQEATPTHVEFKTDGTAFYIVGIGSDTVYQYTLSTAWDLSTASYSTKSMSTGITNPYHFTFNNDGTKIYVVEAADIITQFSLTTAWDISTGSTDSITFNVSANVTGDVAIQFNANGTKLFALGDGVSAIHQYSTSKDGLVLGSGSFASTDVGKRIVGNGGEAVLTATDGSYSEVTAFDDSSTIASGSWSMFALTFDGTDGVKISGLVNAYDIANASYDGVSFSVSGQDGTPTGIAFNNDGTKMYIVGASDLDVNEYALSTAFDISSASFTTNFSVSSQDNVLRGIAFNNDGTKMYIVGDAGDDINEYILSTAFDVSTASFNDNLSVSSEEGSPDGITFNNDGTKMYIVGTTGREVNEYALSTAFDISTATAITKLNSPFDISSEETSPQDIAFNNDGTKMFILGRSADEVNVYTLSTAFDVSTASFDGVTFSVNSEESNPYGLAFNNDGTKMYIVGTSTDSVYQYSTGSLFAPTSAYHPTVTKASGQIDTAYWTDINTMTADETLNGGEVYYAVSTDDRTTWAVIDDTDGVRPIVRNNAGTWEYNDASTYGGTTWTSAATNEELYALQEALEDGVAEEAIGFQDASTWSYDSVSFSVSSQTSSAKESRFNNNGTKLYVLSSSDNTVYQYTVATAFDVSTASYDSVSFSVSSQESATNGLEFNTDGTKMYVIGTTNDTVYQYSLSTAFDLSSASYDSVSFNAGSQSTGPKGLTFNSAGTKMYIVCINTNSVYQYTLSNAFDVSSASYDSISLDISSQDTSASGIAFNIDGTKMYISGYTNENIYQYSLSTAFDLSTASYDSANLDVSSETALAEGVVFNTTGTKMYVTDFNSIKQYSTGTTGNYNRMNSTQLNAVTDPNHYTLGDTLDLAIMLYTESAGSIPESDGVSINYDAEALNKGAVLGTDYDYDFPDSTTVRITSNAAQNLKVRVV